MSKEIDNIIVRNGEPVSKLSASFIESKGLNQNEVDELKDLHVEMMDLQDSIADKEELTEDEAKKYIGTLENIEFDMQELWTFPRSSKFHTHWFNDKNCSCPKMDNSDVVGTGLRYYNGGCKVHKPNILFDEKVEKKSK